MKKWISFEKAILWSKILFSILILFHLTILIGIVLFDFAPVEYLWGGRMETKQELLSFEVLSLLIASFCLLVVLIRSGQIKLPKLTGISRVMLWMLFALFVLNTFGNILAKTNFEKAFSILTFLLAFLCLRLALEPLSIKQKE